MFEGFTSGQLNAAGASLIARVIAQKLSGPVFPGEYTNDEREFLAEYLRLLRKRARA